MKRTKLIDRILPNYCKGEEIMNMVTHIVGGGISILIFLGCIFRATSHICPSEILTSVIFGISMISVYSISSIYHGLHPGTGKKVMQILDHCAIYFLIAGTYTPITVCSIAPQYPILGWGLFALQWILACTATVFTAIDLRRYRVFSMICYIGMGWGILPFFRQTMHVLSKTGFYLLLAGGIAYTIGAVLFCMGKKCRWMHAVFHLFVVIGSLFHGIVILFYVL